MIIDGESYDVDKFNVIVKVLRDKGIFILVVGIVGVNFVELLVMVGSSDKYFFVEIFGGLKGIFLDVLVSVCNFLKVGKIC